MAVQERTSDYEDESAITIVEEVSSILMDECSLAQEQLRAEKHKLKQMVISALSTSRAAKRPQLTVN